MSEAPSPITATDASNAGNIGNASSPIAGTLRSNTLGLRHAIVISVAVMSPAASVFFNTIIMAGPAGAAIPFCFAVGFVVALLVANQYSELSREMPSSGSAYTYVSEGLGPHWSFYFVAAIGIVFAMCYLGVRQSMTVDLGFLAFEIGVCLVLALIVLLHVGQQGGLTPAPFTPGAAPANGDLAVGIVLGVLNFIGFETAATRGEETRNPRRNIPRAVFGSMIVVGIFYLLMAYVATVGYGPSHMVTGYANDSAPFDTISRRFGGATLALFIDLVGIFGFFSAALAIVNGGSRILFSVGRDGLLPRWMAWTHPKRQTPAGAITALCIIGVVVGIGLGLAFTPIGAFSFLGTLDALFILLIYILTNIACFRYFWRKRRQQFSFWRHGLFPALGTLICIGIVAAAVSSPGNPPLNFVPVVVGVWLILGAALILALRSKFAAPNKAEG